jgi:hypothetical protein
LASRIRSSLSVRRRNHASTSRLVSPVVALSHVGMLVMMNDTP